MNIIEYAKRFSSDIAVVKHQDSIYVLDSYLTEDGKREYGVWNDLSIEDVKKGDVAIEDVVPSIYIDAYLDYLVNDSLGSEYGVDTETLDELADCSLEKWSNVLKQHGYDRVIKEKEDLHKILEPFDSPDFKFEPVTDGFINSQIPNADENQLKCIEAYMVECAAISRVSVYPNIKGVRDCLLLDSGTKVAYYKNSETNVRLSMEVVGDVELDYKGAKYCKPSEFSDELKEFIQNGNAAVPDGGFIDLKKSNWLRVISLDEEGNADPSVSWDFDGRYFPTQASIAKMFMNIEQEILQRDAPELE